VLFEGALKCGVATMKIILDGVVATTTSLGDVKCHRSIVTHQKTLAKMVWALETLDLLMALIS
jgi:hypothetical protein